MTPRSKPAAGDRDFFSSLLRNVEGMRIETLDRVLNTVRVTVDRLASINPHDLGLQHSRTTMFNNFSMTYLTAGDVEAANKAATEGLKIASAMSAEFPAVPDVQHDLAVSLQRVGDIKLLNEDFEGALAAFKYQFKLLANMLAKGIHDDAIERDQSSSLVAIGDVKLKLGDRSGAFDAYQYAFRLREKLLEKRSDDNERTRDVLVARLKLGEVKTLIFDQAGAFDEFKLGELSG